MIELCPFPFMHVFHPYSSVGFSHNNETDECELYAKQNNSILLNSTNTKVYLKKGGDVDCIKLENCPKMSLECKDMVCNNCIELVGSTSHIPTNGTLIKVLQQWGPGYEIHLDLKLNTNGYNESTWQDSYDIFQFTTHNGWKNASRIPFMYLQRKRNLTEIDIQSQIGSMNGYIHRIQDVQNGVWNKITLKQIKEVSKLNCKIFIL